MIEKLKHQQWTDEPLQGVKQLMFLIEGRLKLHTDTVKERRKESEIISKSLDFQQNTNGNTEFYSSWRISL